MNLVKYITDRPIYALRARGLEDGQGCFETMSEVLKTYYSHIKKTQSKGPYAILGYSEGVILAFELAKLLEADGDKVVFCGAMDMPPYFQTLLGKTDWVSTLVKVCYFLQFTTREHAYEMEDGLRQGTREEAIIRVLELVPLDRRQELDLNRDTLVTLVDVTKSLLQLLVDYEPRGDVETKGCVRCQDLGYNTADRVGGRAPEQME